MRVASRPRAAPPDPRGFELEADTIRVLANPKRLMIIGALAEGPLSVTELSERLRFSLPNTSQHLAAMRSRSIVRAERSGREIRYALANPVFSEACALVRRALLTEARARPTYLEAPAARRTVPAAREPRSGRPVPVPA